MTKRISVEECTEKARKFIEENDGVASSIIVISSSDETRTYSERSSTGTKSLLATYADDSVVSDASVFDHSDENIKMETTRSITSTENDASVFSFKADEVIKRDANLSGKRFERVTGVKDGRNGLIKTVPLTNHELCLADTETEVIYSHKSMDKFSSNDVELYADEVLKITNDEATYVDLYVQAYFSFDDLGDQKIFNEDELELSSLGSPANYRTRVQDASIYYFACRYKWNSFRSGKLAQRLPTWIKGREFLSNSRANALKVPYNEVEANQRFDKLIKKLDKRWIDNHKVLKLQMDTVISLLQIGAYSLPQKVLTNEKLDVHLQDVLKKDLNRCLNEIRQGLVFVPPARQIQIILNDFMRVSQDSYPYSFFATTKTATFAASNVTEAPMSTIRLVGTDGLKRYKKFNYHVLVLETQYMNLYYGLFLSKHGCPADSVLNTVRNCPVPPMKVVQAINMIGGTAAVTSPPPHLLNKAVPSSPTPKGKAKICVVELDDLPIKEVLITDKCKDDTDFRNIAIKDKMEENEENDEEAEEKSEEGERKELDRVVVKESERKTD